MKNTIILIKYFCAIILFFTCNIVDAQTTFKSERRIYLWDVTLSMKGYNGAPDIWNEVVENLSRNINDIIDEETEIIVLPFQTSILEEWTAIATLEGKANIIKKIKSYNNENVTNTNICFPMRRVMDKYLHNEKRNILFLLTDGNHNTDGHYLNSSELNIDCLLRQVNEWCNLAMTNDAYGFYVMLTENAENEYLQKAISESCRISTITGTQLNFVELLLNDSYLFNLKDEFNSNIQLPIICKKNFEIPTGVVIRVHSTENDYFVLDEKCTIEKNQIKFKLRFKDTYNNLKNILPKDYNENIDLYLSLDEQTKIDYPQVLLLSEKIKVSLINKPEKTLRIYVDESDEE